MTNRHDGEGGVDGFDEIIRRHQDREQADQAERDKERAKTKDAQRWQSAWRAMDDESRITAAWTDRETENLLKLAEVIRDFERLVAVERIASRLQAWLLLDAPTKYQLPFGTIRPLAGPQTERYMVETAKGMLACAKLLIDAIDGKVALGSEISYPMEWLRSIQWGRLCREVSVDPDLPIEPVLIGPKVMIGDPPPPSELPPLSENDVAILCEMHSRGVDADNPKTLSTIIGWLKWGTESKRAMENLKKLGYVKSAKKLGFFLTESGEQRAKRLSG